MVVEASVGSKHHITEFASVGKHVGKVLCFHVVSNICWWSIGEVMAVATEVDAQRVTKNILLQVLRTAQPSWANLCQPPIINTTMSSILFILSTLGQVEVKCSFSILCNTASRTTVEEWVREVSALNVPLNVGLRMVGKSSAYATSWSSLSSYHILIEIFWRPQDTKMRP